MPFDEQLILRASADLNSSDLATGTKERITATGIDLMQTGVKGLAAVINFEKALVDEGTDTVSSTDYCMFVIAESDNNSTYNDLVCFDKVISTSTPGILIERFATKKRYVRFEAEFYNTTKTTDCQLSPGAVEALISPYPFKVL